MRMSMRTRFRVVVAFVVFLLFIPLAAVMFQASRAVEDNHHGEQAYDVFAAALRAAQYVSVERGPSNGALGAEEPLADDLAASLHQARRQSDRALATLGRALAAGPPSDSDQPQWRAAQVALQDGRGQIDQLLAEPLAERGGSPVQQAVSMMISVVPHLLSIASSALAEVPASEAGTLRSAQIAANLREQAGLLGSRLTAAYVTQRPLTATEQTQIDNGLGHVQQLVTLLDQQGGVIAVQEARMASQLDSIYLGRGLRIFDGARTDLSSGTPSGTAAEFAAAYVPTMEPIIDLRDRMLAAAAHTGEEAAERAHRNLLLAISVSLGLLVSAVLMSWGYERRIIAPISDAAQAILDLLDDENVRGGRNEIVALQLAVRALSRHEQQRDHQIRTLEAQASTDPLTGALNLRALRAAFPPWLISDDDRHRVFAVLDVDHFKQINDAYGHPAGDQALRDLVAHAHATFGPDAIIARIGGEEFAVLANAADPAAGIALVEGFRRMIATTPVTLDTGEKLGYTISVGVVVSPFGAVRDFASAVQHADRLLYAAKRQGRDRVEYAVLPQPVSAKHPLRDTAAR